MTRRRWNLCVFAVALPCLPALAGCTGISVAPTCPNELAVGAAGAVSGGVLNPGAIPVYLWEAIPSTAGTFDDPTMPVARFTASNPGDVTITLTASDGLYQVQSSCHITVTGGTEPPPGSGIIVALSANPAAPVTDQPVTVTCRSTGDTPATAFDIQAVAGLGVTLTPLGASSVVFTPTAAGSVTFQCIGLADDGSEGNPATLALTIAEPPGGGRPPR